MVASLAVLEAIGNTPIVQLQRVVPRASARVLAKLESSNPTGSMKDRMARAAVEAAIVDGRLPPGGTMVVSRVPGPCVPVPSMRLISAGADSMSRFLVHLATGPENTTRGALAFLVARTAAAAGHDVSMFLAGDAVGYLRDATMDTAHGIGTGSVREHWAAIADAGVAVYASGMSSKARALDVAGLGDKRVEFVPPDRLVELMAEADTVVTY